jgi:putative spermidine/putrescine transport system permease protein
MKFAVPRPGSGMTLVLPMLIVSIAFFLLPLGMLVLVSLTGWPMSAPNLAGYTSFFGDAFNRSVLLSTLTLGAKVVGLTTLVGLPIALLYLHAGARMRQLLIFLILLPMLTSSVVRTFAWIVILGREGLINTTLLGLGLSSTPIRLLFTEFGLVLALTQIELPLLLLPLIAVLGRLDHRHIEAAATLQAGPWRILATVILPQALPGLLAGWILVFASAATAFVTQGVIGGARNIYLPLFVYQQVSSLFNWQFAAAIAVIMLTSTGTVLIGLSLIGRHRRFMAHG